MAAVIPLVATFVGGVASGVGGFAAIGALATSGVAGFLSVAGGVLGTLGAVTGNKKMGQLGALMGLGGALSGLAGAAGATSAAGGTQSGMMGGLADLDAAAQAGASMPGAASPAFDLGQSAGQGIDSAAAGFSYGADPQAADFNSAFGGSTAPGMTEGAQTLQQAGQTSFGQPGVPLYEQAMQAQSVGAAPAGMPSGVTMGGQASPTDPLAKAGSGMSLGDIVKSAGQKLAGVPDWIKANPELTKIGGQMLASMYGPQAEQLDWQKSIMARRLANMNSPVRMGIRDPAPAPLYGG